MSAKRKLSEDDINNGGKKERKIPFSSSDYLKTKLKVGDKSATIVGYIDEVFGTETFPNKSKGTEFNIFKFIINNNDGLRVQCNIYDDNIPTFYSQIKLNDKILLETVAVSKAKSYTNGNVSYELNAHSTTLLKYYKFRRISIKKFKTCENFISRNSIQKRIHKIQGFLRNCFVQKNKKKENELFGAITDGRFKLEILLFKDENYTNIERGSKLEIIGEIYEKGQSYILKVRTFDHLKIFNEKMELEDLIAGSEIFLKESEDEEKMENL